MSDFTTRDGCRIDYQVRGEGERALVLLTGWSQSAATFDRLVAALGPDHRVVTWDYRNHGASGASPKGARIATLAADLGELVAHLGIEQADYLGHSMGCSVLYSYIDMHGTDSVSSLILVDQPTVCALVPWLAPEDAAQVGAILDFEGAYGFVQVLDTPDGPAAREAFLRSMLTEDISDEDFEFLKGENMSMQLPFGSRLLLDHVMQDWRDVLPTIDVPTLVIGGEVSHVVPSSQEWTAAQIPGAELRIFTREEGGAHFAFFEQVTPFADTVRDFLARHR